MKKKKELVPFEKANRSIQLDPRGKPERVSVLGVFLLILAACCMMYCVTIAFFTGYGSKFFLIWGMISIACMIWAVLLFQRKLLRKIPKWIKIGFFICLGIGFAVFLQIETMILKHWLDKPTEGADYCIVLGAQWKQGRPSFVLQKRLDAAVIYLRENPDTKVIVSGGQGSNEAISEAEGMAGYLENAGVAPERIIQENRSTSTHENLKYSAAFLNPQKDHIVIVTNNFHVFRAKMLAKKLGYLHVEGLSADSYPYLLPNNMLREFAGVLKDFLVGNL